MLGVSTSDRRARDQDRDAAIEIVEAAWADGQIIEADRDKRVEELLRAQTLDEIDMFTRDLQPARAASPVPYGPPMAAGSVGTAKSAKLPRALVVVPLVALLLVGLAAAGSISTFIGLGESVDEIASDSPTFAPGEEAEPGGVNVLSAQGYDDFVAAVRGESGATTASSAVLYPTYAVVDLPVDTTTQRQDYFRWDGRTLTDQNSKSTSTHERFDLGEVDGAVVVQLVKKVRRLATEPTSWYAIVRAPREDGSMIWAYASNEYNESVYVGARPDGTIVYNSTKQ